MDTIKVRKKVLWSKNSVISSRHAIMLPYVTLSAQKFLNYILDMDRRLMSLIFLFVTSSILGSVNGGEEDECNDDDDCWNRYVFGDGEYDEDTCCQGKCETHCPM